MKVMLRNGRTGYLAPSTTRGVMDFYPEKNYLFFLVDKMLGR